jgi:predicted transcriptional regulator
MRRAGPPREIPPPLELECLKMLWSLGEGSVREVRQALAPSRSLAYTTVMTVLERMVRKGGVARRKVGRSFVYVPVVSRDALRRRALKELLESFFGGSREELLAFLNSPSPATPEPAGREHSAESLDTALL